jgi:hypothetical protein
MCCADHFELKENKMVANQHLATFDFPWLLARIFLQIRKTIIHPSRDSCLSLSSSQTGVQASCTCTSCFANKRGSAWTAWTGVRSRLNPMVFQASPHW